MKEIYCARCQAITPHKGSVDQNGEFLFECLNVVLDVDGKQVLDVDGQPELCDRFVKFPSDTDPLAFPDMLLAHEEANIGQVSLEQSEKKLQLLLDTDTTKLTQLDQTPEPVVPEEPPTEQVVAEDTNTIGE